MDNASELQLGGHSAIEMDIDMIVSLTCYS